jgi:hypothetical protein
VSGITTLNNNTIIETLNVSGITTLNSNTTIIGTLNVNDSSYFKDINMGTGTSKLTTSVIHLANNNLDTLNYGARIVSLYNGVNGHNLQFQTRNTPTGAFENNFVINSSGNVSIIKDLKVAGKLGVGTSTPNNILEVSGENTSLRVSDYRLLGEPAIEFVKGKDAIADKTFGSDFHTDWKIKTTMNGDMEFYRKRTAGNGNDFDGACVKFSNFGNITCDKVTANNMIKKSLFNFTCSTPVVFNGQTYYRYDIYLNSYTNFNSTLSGSVVTSKTRKFKWMSWLTNGANNTNHELNYDITYTQRFYSPPGFFVCAYGWPNDNKALSNLSSDGTCLLKNTFDYITVCSSIQNTLMSAIIIDYL